MPQDKGYFSTFKLEELTKCRETPVSTLGQAVLSQQSDLYFCCPTNDQW